MPGGTDERVSDAYITWAARQVVRQHEEPPSDHRVTGGCARCPGDGRACEQLAWARQVLRGDQHPR